MGKLAGSFLNVLLDDNTPTARDVSGDINSVDIPEVYDELDTTGFGHAVKNSQPGLPGYDVELAGDFNPTADTGFYTVLVDIWGKNSTHTLTVQVGDNTTPTGGDPEFEGEFWCPKVGLTATPTGKTGLVASLRPYGSTKPTWGTMS